MSTETPTQRINLWMLSKLITVPLVFILLHAGYFVTLGFRTTMIEKVSVEAAMIANASSFKLTEYSQQELKQEMASQIYVLPYPQLTDAVWFFFFLIFFFVIVNRVFWFVGEVFYPSTFGTVWFRDERINFKTGLLRQLIYVICFFAIFILLALLPIGLGLALLITNIIMIYRFKEKKQVIYEIVSQTYVK
jgi:hypothetical protein